jgi:hypothetical protein
VDGYVKETNTVYEFQGITNNRNNQNNLLITK